MNTQLSNEQIRQYREQGFLQVNDFLSASELDPWRAVVAESVTRRGDTVILGLDAEKTKKAQSGDDAFAKVFKQRVNLWVDNRAMRPLMVNAALGKMAAELAGVDGIRIWHDQALIKEPWANATAWHKDCPYWSFHSPNALTIWIALEDATFQNGCLYFLPGTHRDGSYRNANLTVNMDSIFEAYPEYRKSPSVSVPLRAGSCTFHNGLTIHGAGPNMTPGWRRAMTCAFMPDGATFNGQANILTPAQASALKVGDLLDDDRQNPLIWSRTKPYVTSDAAGNLSLNGRPIEVTLDRVAYRTPRS